MTYKSNEFLIKLIINEKSTLCDFLAMHCDLPRMRIKDALNKGAVLLHRPHSKRRRVRKAKFKLLPGDTIQFGYSEKILKSSPLKPGLLHEEFHYSIWNKPAAMLTQGTQYGDHCSLVRYIELYYNHRRDIKVVHRLDRDASGIILFAHTRLAANKLSKLFSEYTVLKKYKASVCGIMGAVGESFLYTDLIDGKKSSTLVEIVGVDEGLDSCDLDITLQTGRKHQIRRHLSINGHPIIGDVKYGNKTGSQNTPFQLTSYMLSFDCPFNHSKVTFQI